MRLRRLSTPAAAVLLALGAVWLAWPSGGTRTTPGPGLPPLEQARGEPGAVAIDGPAVNAADETTLELRRRAAELERTYAELAALHDAAAADADQIADLAALPYQWFQLPAAHWPPPRRLADMWIRTEAIYRTNPTWTAYAPAARDQALRNLWLAAAGSRDDEEQRATLRDLLKFVERALQDDPADALPSQLLLYRHRANRMLSRWSALGDDLQRELQWAEHADPVDTLLAAEVLREEATLHLDYGTVDRARDSHTRAATYATDHPELHPALALLDVRISFAAGQWRRAIRALEADDGPLVIEPALRKSWLTRARIRLREERLGLVPPNPRGPDDRAAESVPGTTVGADAVAATAGDARNDETLQDLYAELAAVAALPEMVPLERAAAVWWTVMYHLQRGEIARAEEVLALGQRPWTTDSGELLPGDAMLLAARAHLTLARFEAGAIPAGTVREFLPVCEGALARQIERWAAAPLLPGGLGRLHYGVDRQILRDLILLRLAIQETLGDREVAANQAFADLLRLQESGTLARAMRVDPVRWVWEDVRAALIGEQDGLLAYLPGGYIPLVLAADRESVQIARLQGLTSPDVVRLAHDTDRVMSIPADTPREAFLDGSSDDATAVMRRLGAFLLPAPIANKVRRWSGVTVCGLDDLGRWPIEGAILDPEPLAVTLGVTHAVRHIPSLAIGAHLATLADPTDRALDVALVGPPDDGLFSQQPSSQRPSSPRPSSPADRASIPLEDDVARSWFPAGQKVRIFSRSEATVARALSTGWSADTLILLGHGVREARAGTNGTTAAIQLSPDGPADDGRLGSARLDILHRQGRNHDAPANVFLAACGSAAGVARIGDQGAQHLVGAFHLAGVRTVIASPWDLEIDTTIEILQMAGPAIAGPAGADPASAMRDARATLFHAGVTHPALIAAWRVSGPRRH